MLIENVSNVSSANVAKSNNNGSPSPEEFFNLLVTQLRYQDPMSPDDTGDLTQQLTMFNIMDQGVRTNDYLSQILAMQQEQSAKLKIQDVVNYLERTVEVDTSQILLVDDKAECNFTLPEDVSSVRLAINNVNGEEVYSTFLDELDTLNEFIWDGQDTQGNSLESGKYKLSLSYIDNSGRDTQVTPKVSGIVNSISSVSGDPYLEINGMFFDPENIVSITQNI